MPRSKDSAAVVANGEPQSDASPPARTSTPPPEDVTGGGGAAPGKLWPPPQQLATPNRESAAQIEKGMKQFAVKVSAIGSIGGLLFGYDLGVVSGALLQLSARFDLQRPEEKGLVVSILLVGSVLGAFFGGVFTDRYGRRIAIMCTDVMFISGSLIIATAPTLAQVLIGRFAVGIGVSVSAIADVAYLNEMAPQKWRGTIVSVNEMMIAAGFLLANFVDGVFATTPGGWRYMFGFASLIAALQLVGMSFMPRSPRWLLLQVRPAPIFDFFQPISALFRLLTDTLSGSLLDELFWTHSSVESVGRGGERRPTPPS